MPFLKTADPAAAKYLRSNAYTEMPPQGNLYVFLNDGKATFTDEFKKKIIIDNKLHI